MKMVVIWLKRGLKPEDDVWSHSRIIWPKSTPQRPFQEIDVREIKSIKNDKKMVIIYISGERYEVNKETKTKCLLFLQIEPNNRTFLKREEKRDENKI